MDNGTPRMAALTFPWGITIPFREDPNPNINRRALLNTVLTWLEHACPGIPVQLVDSNPTLPFNRAGARNNAVRHAETQGWEVVMILDADTLPKTALIHEAVEAAHHGGIHFPFTCCVTLDPEAGITNPDTLRPAHLGKDFDARRRLWKSPGSCYIVRPDVYWAAGGQDEAFRHWGGEDTSFMAAARALNIPTVRHPVGDRRRIAENAAIQLHHGTDSDRRQHPTYRATLRRQNIYVNLSRNSNLMRQWLKERHHPGAEERWSTVSDR